MPLLKGYRLGQLGRIEWATFDSSDFPKGWYTSPDHIPNKPAEPAPPPYRTSLDGVLPTGPAYGERRRPGRPRKSVA